MIMWRRIALIVIAVATCSPPAAASPASRTATRAAYALAYELRFPEALALLESAERADPGDPAPPRAVAAITWMEILFAQGVATFEAFSGQPSRGSVSRPEVPAELTRRFLTYAERATGASNTQGARDAEDRDAEYQRAATAGLLALYRSTVEGQTLAAFREGRRAVAAMQRIRAADPRHRESALIPGIYQYAVSTLPLHLRLLATIGGLPGDREGGIALLEIAAGEGADTATDASLVLMTVYNREGRAEDAFRHLARLQRRHPGNRLLRLNTAASALASGKPQIAEREVTLGLPLVLRNEPPHVAGELALWMYTRGAARAEIRHPDAAADLQECLRAHPRAWVKGRAHLALGKLALLEGRAAAAQADLQQAAHYARESGDEVSVQAVKSVLTRKPTGRTQDTRRAVGG